MTNRVTTITLPMPYRLGNVNCYLLAEKGHILIDTGCTINRASLFSALGAAGCTADSLQLVILTHGDFDHGGNGANLRRAWQARVAMHPGDVGMVARGDMFAGRNKGSVFVRKVAPLVLCFGPHAHFEPDVLLEDGDDLSAYGLSAHVLRLPGHSAGSIAVLTDKGELFCGDLLENTAGPAVSRIMDDAAAARATVEMLRRLNVRMVYPGHGAPFAGLELEKIQGPQEALR